MKLVITNRDLYAGLLGLGYKLGGGSLWGSVLLGAALRVTMHTLNFPFMVPVTGDIQEFIGRFIPAAREYDITRDVAAIPGTADPAAGMGVESP